jgi:hypothetical protein
MSTHPERQPMAQVTHQTVTLSRGKHRSPEEGACVMELASMLAGEPFTDHPRSVCPVIASVLRAYNDWSDNARRQDLYGYAAKVVGSRAGADVERARVERLRRWVLGTPDGRLMRLFVPRRLRMWMRSGQLDIWGPDFVRTIAKRGFRRHTEVLALIDELLIIGEAERIEHATGRAALALPQLRESAHTIDLASR